MTNQSEVEDELNYQIKAIGLPAPERQAKIIPCRRFAFDFVWSEFRLAVDVQGGTWKPNTGHSSGTGIERDCEKLNLAILNGWRVLFVTTGMVNSGMALRYIEDAIKASPAGGKETSGIVSGYCGILLG